MSGLKTKEQVIEKVLRLKAQHLLRLSKSDNRVFEGVITTISDTGKITTGQSDLVDTLLTKYKKQLAEVGLVYYDLIALPWDCRVVETNTQSDSPRMSLVNGQLRLWLPFNKPFVTEFRSHSPNPFVWDKETVTYKCPFSTYALKLACRVVNMFYDNMTYCPELTATLDQAYIPNLVGTEVWDPTLALINGRVVMLAGNGIVEKAIQPLLSSGISPRTAFEITEYGVGIHESLRAKDLGYRLAGEKVIDATLDNWLNIIDELVTLGFNHVRFDRASWSKIGIDECAAYMNQRGLTSSFNGVKLKPAINDRVVHVVGSGRNRDMSKNPMDRVLFITDLNEKLLDRY